MGASEFPGAGRAATDGHLDHRGDAHLEAYLRSAFARGDDVAAIVDVRDRLGFHARTLRSWARAAGLDRADSIGIDFHKTGYTPYVSSLFLLRDREHLKLISRRPQEMPYLDRLGRYHPGYYTLECSRSGASPLAALANIQLLGKAGYRVMIGHVVEMAEMAEMLREKLEGFPFVRVLNDYNYGPVTLIRLYPDGCAGPATYQRELHEPGYGDRVIATNRFNHRIYEAIHARAMRGEGVPLSWTEFYRHTPDGQPVGAIKSFIMNPRTDLSAVETGCRQLLEARQQAIAADP